MSLSEKKIEDVFEQYYKELISSDLKYVDRQVRLDNGLRIDLLFKDSNGKNVIVELKKDAVTREDVGQTIQYAGLIKDSRVILAAPIISESIKIAFEHYGIEYLEFNQEEVEKLHDKMELNKKKNIQVQKEDKIVLPQNLLTLPLSNQPRKDGNIAFKVTYVDRNWSGVCSDKIFDYNKNHRVWCAKQFEYGFNCRDKEYKNGVTGNNFPCYDSVAMQELLFSPGVNHGEKKDGPRRCLEAKVGKIALFTSREPGESENQRFIFAIAEIETFLPPYNDISDSEIFKCKEKTAIRFAKNQYPLFWKFFKNKNNPNRIAWNTGLIRYTKDEVIFEFLKDIIENNKYSEKQKENAKILIKKVA